MEFKSNVMPVTLAKINVYITFWTLHIFIIIYCCDLSVVMYPHTTVKNGLVYYLNIIIVYQHAACDFTNVTAS